MSASRTVNGRRVRVVGYFEFSIWLASSLTLCHVWAMRKRVKQGRRPTDINQIAHQLVEQSIYEPEAVPEAAPQVPASLSKYMAAIGKKGGKIGGKRRLSTMSAKERKKIASKAANARWAKTRKSGPA